MRGFLAAEFVRNDIRSSRISYRHSRSSERDERERENGSLTGVGRNTRNARISREKSRQMLKFARRKQEGQRRRRRRRRRPRSLSFKRSGGETLIAASNITGEVRTWAPFHSALQLREAERRREEGATQRGYLSWKRELKRLRCSPSSPLRSGIFARKEVAAQRSNTAPLPPELFSWKDSILAVLVQIRDVLLLIWAHFQRKERILTRLQK